jgi:predicted P-loop ATPase/GTPase
MCQHPSHDRIEDLVKTCYLSSDASTTQAKKRKLKMYSASKKPIKQELSRRVGGTDAYEQRGTKLRHTPNADEEASLMERLDRSSEDVDISAQQATRSVHRSQLDSDFGYINNEVEIFLLESSSQQ